MAALNHNDMEITMDLTFAVAIVRLDSFNLPSDPPSYSALVIG